MRIHINGVTSVTYNFFFKPPVVCTRIDIIWDQSARSFSFFSPFALFFSVFVCLFVSVGAKKSVAKMSSRVQSRVHEGRRFQDTMAHRRDAIRHDATRYNAMRCATWYISRCSTVVSNWLTRARIAHRLLIIRYQETFSDACMRVEWIRCNEAISLKMHVAYYLYIISRLVHLDRSELFYTRE